MAKPHQHNTKTNKTQHTQAAALRPDFTGRQVSFRTPSRTYGSDGRGCRSDGRLRRLGSAQRSHAPRTFLSATATATATSLSHAPAVSQAAPPTTASTRLQCRPTVPVPVLSRRTDWQSLQLLPTPATSTSADVHWLPVSSGGPTQHPAFPRQQRTGTAVPSRQRRQHSRCEAPLRQPKSLGLSAVTLSAHCRALSQLSFPRLRSTFHTATAHCKIRAFSSTV